MTNEESVQRGVFLHNVNKTRTTTEMRLDFLEADASAQRTAILQVERKVVVLAGAIALAGIVALAFKIALEVLK